MPAELHRRVIKVDIRTPQLYFLPKIHKPDVPLRLIVSATSSATPLHRLNTDRTSRENTTPRKKLLRFLEKMKRFRLEFNDILMCFEVTLLFTKILLDGVLDVLMKRLQDDNLDEELARLGKI